MTEKFNPINIWNKHKYVDVDNDRIDEPSQQRSSSIDQGNTNAQAQREPVQVLPSDFGSRILNPVEQDSNFKNDSEDMISRNKKPTNYDLFNMKTGGDHKTNTAPNATFFGDSNVARRTSRSTLDQEGLHRGNISTLPSAGDARRLSIRQHADDPAVSEVKNDNNSSFMGRTTAAVVSSLGAATAVATGFGVSDQLRDISKQENTAMPSTWPESPKVNDSVEPAIHGQTACYKHKDEVCDTITDSDKHSFCDRVQEPAIHGQTPSFYQENVNNTTHPTVASVNKNNGATHQTIAAAVGEATTSVQNKEANVNNSTAKPPTPVRRLSNSLGNLFGKSSPTKEKSNDKSLWSAGNTMDTSNNSKKGLLAGAGLGAGLGGVLSRKNQINDAKSTDAYQLLGSNTGNTTSLENTKDQAVPSTPPHATNFDDESVTESVDELPQTWGDQSSPVVLDDQDPLSRPHAADRAFAAHDLGHPSHSEATQDTTTQAQIVHNDINPNADHAKMGFDKKSSAAAGILGGAGIGAAVGSLFGRDKKSNTANSNTVKKVDAGLDQSAFGNNEQQAFGGNQALGNTPVVLTSDTVQTPTGATQDVNLLSTHAPINKNAHTAKGAGTLGGAGLGAAAGASLDHNKNNATHPPVDDSHLHAHRLDYHDELFVTSPTDHTVKEVDLDRAQVPHNNDNHNKLSTAAGVLGGAGIGAGVGSILSRDKHDDNYKATAHPLDDGDRIIATPHSENRTAPVGSATQAQMVHNDIDPNADHAKMGFDKKSSTVAGVLGGAGLGAGIGSMLGRNKHNDNDKSATSASSGNHNTNATLDSADHSQVVHNDVDPNADHAKMGFDKKSSTVAGVLGGAGLGTGIGFMLGRNKHNDNDKSATSASSGNRNTNATLDSADHAQVVHNDADPNADHAKMGFNKRPSISELTASTGVGAGIGSIVGGNKHNDNDKSAATHRDTNTDLGSATQAQTVHNDINQNADHSKMGFNKKSGIGAGILGGAGIGAAMSSLLGRKKSNDSDINNKSTTTSTPVVHDQASTVNPTSAAVNTGAEQKAFGNNEQKAFGNNEQQAFGGGNAFGDAPIVGILKKPAAVAATAAAGTGLVRDENVSPHAKGPIIHNALNINKNNNANTTATNNNDITHASSATDKHVDMNQPWTNTEVDQQAVKPRRWSTTSTTPDHHVEKRLAVGGIMGATANTEGRIALNKLYPENTHWDSNAPIESRLGEVEITDQPRRRSSVSETLGNMFGMNKNKVSDDSDVQHNTIHEVNTTHPVQSPMAGVVGKNNHLTPTAAAAGATGAGIVGAPNVNNYDESISSTRATRGIIVPDDARHNEVKDRLTTTPHQQNFAHVPDSIQRDAPTSPNEPRRKSSFTKGIKGSITKAVRRLSSRRKSSIKKDSIHVRHLSDAEMFKKQTLGSQPTALGDGSNTNPALGSTAAAAVPVHAAPAHATTGNENIGPLDTRHDIVHPAATTGVPVQENSTTTPLSDVTNGDFGNTTTLRRGSSTSSDHLKYTGVQKGYARIPGVHTLRPADDAHAPDNNESYFIKEEVKAPTKSTLVSGHMEARRGSFQKTMGKIIGSGSMQDQGALKEVSGQGKINAYNATHNKF